MLGSNSQCIVCRSVAYCCSRLTKSRLSLGLFVVVALGLGGALVLRQTNSLADDTDQTPVNVRAASYSLTQDADQTSEGDWQLATFGNGCFWCTEAVFQRVKGVLRVTSGYMGGHVPNPTYEMVLTKKTGHAEVLHIAYDPKVVSYEKLLEIFWATHDPTTLNRQGNDVGPQYRSAVFYHTPEQKELAEKYKKRLDESKAFRSPIVTEITKASTFYPAEDYHQNYYNRNKRLNPYCRQIDYKLKKFRQAFADVIDPEQDVLK